MSNTRFFWSVGSFSDLLEKEKKILIGIKYNFVGLYFQ